MKRSKNQEAASKRNHLILRLRGAWSLAKALNSSALKDVIDNELTKLGAETETLRYARWIKELENAQR